MLHIVWLSIFMGPLAVSSILISTEVKNPLIVAEDVFIPLF